MLYRVLNTPQNEISGNVILSTVNDKIELATGLVGQVPPQINFFLKCVFERKHLAYFQPKSGIY